MTNFYQCPACEKKLASSENMVGALVHCSECNTLLEVPLPESSIETLVASKGKLPVAIEPAVDFRARKHIPQDEMDMTPMVDVTFLLLIFFMVTAAFSLQKSFEIPAPQETPASVQVRTIEDFEDDPEYVIVRVDAFNTFYVGADIWDEEQEAPRKQDLIAKLREARQGGSGAATKLLILAHGDALHEKIVAALDAGTLVGMEEVKLVTIEEEL